MSRTKMFFLSLPIAILLAGIAWYFVPTNDVAWTEPEERPIAFSIENKRKRTISAFDFVLDSWRQDRRQDARDALKELYLGDLKNVLAVARLNNGRNVLILEQRYGHVLYLMQTPVKQADGLKAISALKTMTLSHLDTLEPDKPDPIASNDE